LADQFHFHSLEKCAHPELVEGSARNYASIMPFYVYILRCSDGSYYTGHTDNLDIRMSQHTDGIGSKYTAKRRPLELIWATDCQTREEAFELERRLHGWSRAKKEALMRGDLEALPGLARNRSRQHPSTSSG
jgi:predicted GIY-YIG superfamily endonuclease